MEILEAPKKISPMQATITSQLKSSAPAVLYSLGLHFVFFAAIFFLLKQVSLPQASSLQKIFLVSEKTMQSRESLKEKPAFPESKVLRSPTALTPRNNFARRKTKVPKTTSSQAPGEIILPISYPRASRLLGEEGDVVFRFQRNPEGQIVATKLLNSTGHARLDRAAQAALEVALKSESLPLALDIQQIRFVFQLNKADRR